MQNYFLPAWTSEVTCRYEMNPRKEIFAWILINKELNNTGLSKGNLIATNTYILKYRLAIIS